MWTMPSERARQENCFLVLSRIVLTLVTLYMQEDLRDFMKIVENTLNHSDPRQCIRELANVMNCDHSNIVRHLHSMGKVETSCACSKPKPQKISGCSYVHLCLLVTDWLVNNIGHCYPVSLLITRNGVFKLT